MREFDSARSIVAKFLIVFTLILSGITIPAHASNLSYEPDIVLVAIVDKSKISDLLTSLGAKVVRDYPLTFAHLLRIQTPVGKAPDICAALAKDPSVAGAQLNYRCAWNETSAAVNDPYFSNQWNLFYCNFPKAWLASKAYNHYITFMDSGVTALGDLAGKVMSGAGADVVYGSSYGGAYGMDEVPEGGHGTKVASVVAAICNNQKEIAGADKGAYAWQIKIGNQYGTDDEHIIMGIDAARKRSSSPIVVLGACPVDVGWTLKSHPLVYGMLAVFHEDGGLVFAPAGNSGVRLNGWIDTNLILVGATDKDGKRSGFSNYGGPVWFAAPGSNIFATDNTGKLVTVSGTSYAAAQVAAVAAIVWNNHPTFTADEVLYCLAKGTTSAGGGLGYGIIDAEKSLAASGTFVEGSIVATGSSTERTPKPRPQSGTTAKTGTQTANPAKPVSAPATSQPVTTHASTPATPNAPAAETANTPAPEAPRAPAPETANTPAPETANTPAPETANTPAPETANTPAPEAPHAPAAETANTPAPEAPHAPAAETANTPAPEAANTPAPEAPHAPAAETANASAPEPTSPSAQGASPASSAESSKATGGSGGATASSGSGGGGGGGSRGGSPPIGSSGGGGGGGGGGSGGGSGGGGGGGSGGGSDSSGGGGSYGGGGSSGGGSNSNSSAASGTAAGSSGGDKGGKSRGSKSGGSQPRRPAPQPKPIFPVKSN